ncbi:MAG: gamma-glutamyl-gamma-aminobutyrate hydrolase family protein, partial [Pseudomonadota bacterium]
MTRPVIGIIANRHLINDQYMTQAAGTMNIDAVAEVTGGLPLLVPALPDACTIPDLLSACAGFVFTGGRPNVHPSHYGEDETEAHGPFDPDRDMLTLPLIRAAVENAVPVLGLCRGFQEMAVAFGSTLHPEIRDIPGRMNHRMPPDGTLEEKFELRHEVHLSPGGSFARLFGTETIMVNSLHGQGIVTPGDRVRIEG